MLQQIEGSIAVAEAIAMCMPEVVAAYPITPQTHIVEHIGKLVKAGKVGSCKYINMDSEFAAMSACIGSSVMGARSYTATASQGLLFMMEAVYNASGLGLPIVMTLGNRSIGAPINIWNDHTDALAARDSGWIQLFVESNQQAVDVHIQAFKLAEAISLPVMVCMDGFILTHAYEGIDMPDKSQVEAFLPAFEPKQKLDPEQPVSIGAMVGPEAFTEVRYLAHHKQLEALEMIEDIGQEFGALFGRNSGGLLSCFDCDEAETIVIAAGSVIGTIKSVVKDMRAEGHSIGVVSIRSMRPFPRFRLAKILQNAKRVIVFEKAFSVGVGGVLALDVQWALQSYLLPLYSVIGGLGGRSITSASLRKLFDRGVKDQLPQTHFLDLDIDAVNRELERERSSDRSGPSAENIVRDMGVLRAAKTS